MCVNTLERDGHKQAHRVRELPVRAVSLFPPMAPREGTHVVRLGGKGLDLLGHITGHPTYFYVTFSRS